MYPLPQRNTIHNTNARHTAGRFAYYHFPEEILQELTKVNKHGVSYSETINCIGAILPSGKVFFDLVNKMLQHAGIWAGREYSHWKAPSGACPELDSGVWGSWVTLPEPEQIIHRQHTQPRGKQHHRVLPPVLLVKFAYHPYAVGHYPQHYGYVMKELRFATPRAPQQVYGHAQCRGYHHHPANLKLQRPTGIFYQPKQYMAVFQHTVARRLIQFGSSLFHARKIERKTDIISTTLCYYRFVNMAQFPHVLWILSPRPVPLRHVLIIHIK